VSAIAVIPARGGSRRVPLKNIRPFHGKPIIGYSIAAAKASLLFSRVVVSTDHDEIARVAMECGAEVLRRPARLAVDQIGTREVAHDALRMFGDGPYPEVCCIYATSPMLDPYDLARGQTLLHRPGVMHAISVAYPPLQDAAQFYWSRPEALIQNIEYFGQTTALVKVDPARVCDINTESDWQRAETMYAALHQKEAA